MRALLAVVLVVGAQPLHGQQAAPSQPVRLALERQPVPFVSPLPPSWTAPDVKRVGILTLTSPDSSRGEAVRVVVPVGDLVTRAGHALAGAQGRRAEKNAHEEMLRELQDFLARQRQP